MAQAGDFVELGSCPRNMKASMRDFRVLVISYGFRKSSEYERTRVESAERSCARAFLLRDGLKERGCFEGRKIEENKGLLGLAPGDEREGEREQRMGHIYKQIRRSFISGAGGPQADYADV